MGAAENLQPARLVTVACQLRCGDMRAPLTVTMHADDVEGLEGAALWEAVRPAITKALEDLVFVVVEVTDCKNR